MNICTHINHDNNEDNSQDCCFKIPYTINLKILKLTINSLQEELSEEQCILPVFIVNQNLTLNAVTISH